jgi:hypothetical protein
MDLVETDVESKEKCPASDGEVPMDPILHEELMDARTIRLRIRNPENGRSVLICYDVENLADWVATQLDAMRPIVYDVMRNVISPSQIRSIFRRALELPELAPVKRVKFLQYRGVEMENDPQYVQTMINQMYVSEPPGINGEASYIPEDLQFKILNVDEGMLLNPMMTFLLEPMYGEVVNRWTDESWESFWESTAAAAMSDFITYPGQPRYLAQSQPLNCRPFWSELISRVEEQWCQCRRHMANHREDENIELSYVGEIVDWWQYLEALTCIFKVDHTMLPADAELTNELARFAVLQYYCGSGRRTEQPSRIRAQPGLLQCLVLEGVLHVYNQLFPANTSIDDKLAAMERESDQDCDPRILLDRFRNKL